MKNASDYAGWQVLHIQLPMNWSDWTKKVSANAKVDQ